MMIKTFNEEIIRQFTISSFRAIVCLDFLLCPLFPRNTEVTEGRGKSKTQIHANKQRRSQPVICSVTLQLKFRKVEHLFFSPYGRNIFTPRLPPDPQDLGSFASTSGSRKHFPRNIPYRLTGQKPELTGCARQTQGALQQIAFLSVLCHVRDLSGIFSPVWGMITKNAYVK